MRKSKRRLIFTAVVLAPFVALFCLWAFVDAAPPDDADLRLTYEVIPDDQNAFTYFNQAGEHLQWPEDWETSQALDNLLKEDGWNAQLASSVLVPNKDIYALIEQGLAYPHFQVPRPKINGIEIQLPYLDPWRDIARLGVARARLLFEQRRETEAFEQALQVVRFGARVQEGRGAYILFCVGQNVKHWGFAEIRRMLGTTTLPALALAPYIDALASNDVNEEALADAFRDAYMTDCVMVDGMARGKYTLDDVYGMWGHPSGRFMPLKPNMTKRMLATGFRRLIASIREPWCTSDTIEFRDFSERKNLIAAYLSGNGKGLLAYNMLMFPPRIQQFKCAENCGARATRIFIALRCYQLDHGELPETLDALVPDYLDAVPLDDFDGTPMKYSKANKVVYAVGTDLADDGGRAQDDREGVLPDPGYDLIYKIAF
jgi:hypothetical protein